jgi:hypothetical protein
LVVAAFLNRNAQGDQGAQGGLKCLSDLPDLPVNPPGSLVVADFLNRTHREIREFREV